MHQKNLEIDHQTTIKVGDKSWQVTGTSDDNKEETVLFKFPDEVPKTDTAIIHVKWVGDLKKEAIGLYRTTYRDAKGKRHTTISTHFEPTYARRCFPCFDEPKSKATFSIRVVLEARFHVLSNMPPDTEDNIMPNVYPPMREWRFQKTPLMSTYLLGISAGEWDRVERKSKNGAVVRVWTPLGRPTEGEISNEWATRVLDFFDEYFALPYPLGKLDLVPVEDFGPGSAMENWGLITFKARSLLVNSATDAATVQTIKETIAHEIAHMWFGNLVTPRFWDALWLKEGFATYFAYFVCDALEPNAHWKSRFQVQESVRGKRFDSRASTHALEATVSNTGEAYETFDDVAYSKGAALVQMVESYIGSDALRNGVRKYIDQFKYKNAASLDLWLALMKAATDVKGPALKDIMKDWVKQDGFPVVSVERDGGKIKLTQKRFQVSGSTASTHKWITPLRLSNNAVVVIEGESLSIDVDAKLPFVVVNAGQRGFAIVNYQGAEQRAVLIKAFPSLDDRDKTGIIGDCIELCKARHFPLRELLDLFTAISATETSPSVWKLIADFWVFLSVLFDDDQTSKQNLQKHGKALFHKIYTAWGGVKHVAGQDGAIVTARNAIIDALAISDDKDVLLAAQESFDAAGPLAVHVDVRAAVWSAVISKGHKPSLEALNAIIVNPKAYDADVERACWAVQKSRNAADVTKIFQLTIPTVIVDDPLLDRRKAIEGGEQDKIKYKASPIKIEFVVALAEGVLTTNGAAKAAAWSFISSNFDKLVEHCGGAPIAEEFLRAFRFSADDATARSIKDFVGRLNAEVKQYVLHVAEQVAEEIRANTALKTASKSIVAQLQ